MRKLLGLIFNRWVFMTLGVLALCLVVWHVGPLVSIAQWTPLDPEWVRWTIIWIIVGLFVLAIVVRLVKSALDNRKLMEALSRPRASGTKDAPPAAGAEEVALLGKRFQDAAEILKKAKLGSGKGGLFAQRRYVYELPWYMIIGAPGSGKTTALVNSGLEFPLADKLGQGAVRGVAGTRNCDWWFTNDAVLIDTAGRYTTQDSDRDNDAAAWIGVLKLLRQYRPRRPINGVLLTVSAADLLGSSEPEREAHAQRLRARLQELHEHLGIRFPIYVMVTKTDLLAGFVEFFGEAGRDERAQVWGTTFPYDGNLEAYQPLERLPAELATLEQRLNSQVIPRMQAERDRDRRALLYAFPQQLAELNRGLADLLARVFQASRYEDKPLFRGVYFTSGTQEGTPFDRVIGGMARQLGFGNRVNLAAHRPSGKSFFVTRLLQEVVFGESGLAGTNLRWERRRALIEWGVIAASVLVTAGVAALWWMSHAENSRYVQRVDEKLKVVQADVAALATAGPTDLVSVLPVLKSVDALANASEVAGKDAPWSMGLGLYQGDKLGGATETVYARLLKDAFLPRLAARMEQQLRTQSSANPEMMYETLKAYIMLHRGGRHFDAEALKLYIHADWNETLDRSVTPAQRVELNTHLDNLFRQGGLAANVQADERLVADIQNQVARTPLAQRIYNRLKRLGVGGDLAEFTIVKAGGPSAANVFVRASGEPLTRGVPGLFSYNGYKVFQARARTAAAQFAAEESWVLAPPGAAGGTQQAAAAVQALVPGNATIDAVEQLYLTDYANIWEAFVRDIRLRRTRTLRETIEVAQFLSAPDSPLASLFRGIANEVTLGRASENPDRTLADQAMDKMRDKLEELKKLGRAAGAPVPAGPVSTLAERIVDARFETVRRLVNGPPKGQPIDATIALLNDVYTTLLAAESALKSKAAPQFGNLPDRLSAESGRAPEPIKSMLTQIGKDGVTQALEGTRGVIASQVRSEISEFCSKAIAGRYPHTNTAKLDITRDDFARFFSAGGVMDAFFQKNLAPLVDTATKPWTLRKQGDATMGGTDSVALMQFQRAQSVRNVFLGGGGNLRFTFKPVELDANITQITLDIDGQLVRYAHGPQVPVSVQWPGPKGSGQVRLDFAPPTPGGNSGDVFEGPWALFRLMDRAQLERGIQPERVKATFSIEGRRAVFEITASSVENPFRLRDLEQFQCPQGL